MSILSFTRFKFSDTIMKQTPSVCDICYYTENTYGKKIASVPNISNSSVNSDNINDVTFYDVYEVLQWVDGFENKIIDDYVAHTHEHDTYIFEPATYDSACFRTIKKNRYYILEDYLNRERRRIQ